MKNIKLLKEAFNRIANYKTKGLTKENEEYKLKVKELIYTFEPDNIELALQIAEGQKYDLKTVIPEIIELIEWIESYKEDLRSHAKTGDEYFKGAEGLKDKILRIRTLEDLKLANGNVSFIPKGIKLMDNLSKLNLRNNQITFIPKEVGDMKNLTDFDISYNPVKVIDDNVTNPTLKYFETDYTDIEKAPFDLARIKYRDVIGASNNEYHIQIKGVDTLINLSEDSQTIKNYFYSEDYDNESSSYFPITENTLNVLKNAYRKEYPELAEKINEVDDIENLLNLLEDNRIYDLSQDLNNVYEGYENSAKKKVYENMIAKRLSKALGEYLGVSETPNFRIYSFKLKYEDFIKALPIDEGNYIADILIQETSENIRFNYDDFEYLDITIDEDKFNNEILQMYG